MTGADAAHHLAAYEAGTAQLRAAIACDTYLGAAATFADVTAQCVAVARTARAGIPASPTQLERELLAGVAKLHDCRRGVVLEAWLSRVQRDSPSTNPAEYTSARVELAAMLPSSVNG